MLKFNTETKRWSNGSDVPLEGNDLKYYEYGAVVHGKEVFYFGGRVSYSQNKIFRYCIKLDQWKLIGTLQQNRYAHSAIQQANGFTIIGGNGNYYHEYCYISTDDLDQMECGKKMQRLNGYAYYPELVHVHDNFCQ